MIGLTTAKRIVTAAIDQGFAVSIHDGEEWAIKKSTNKKAAKAALGATDSETIRLRDIATEIKIGDILIVYGNSEEEAVSDYSDNPAMNAFLKGLGL